MNILLYATSWKQRGVSPSTFSSVSFDPPAELSAPSCSDMVSEWINEYVNHIRYAGMYLNVPFQPLEDTCFQSFQWAYPRTPYLYTYTIHTIWLSNE